MPASGKDQEHRPGSQRVCLAVGFENALSVDHVDQLVFVEHPAGGHVEIITGRVVGRRIGFVRGDALKTDRRDGNSPQPVPIVRHQVFELALILRCHRIPV